MILIDYFTEACCKGTELLEGWYWHEDDGEEAGGPYEDEEAAIEAAQKGTGWKCIGPG
ncbi:MAG: hypothetical protein VKK63_08495 [Synechococcus sp.]|nr:hypothetical protein [Synechococcus sp.]